MKNSNVLETLEILRDGKALTVADHFLSQCAMAACVCGITNPKVRGKFTITLEFRPSASGSGNAVTVRYVIGHASPTITGKESETTEGEEIMLVSTDGKISRAEPQSMEIFSGFSADDGVINGRESNEV